MRSATKTSRPRKRYWPRLGNSCAQQLGYDASGHDWWHVERVANLARRIAEAESANSFICQLAALLHDVADYKIAGDEATGLRRVRSWLDDPGSGLRRGGACARRLSSRYPSRGGNQPPMRTLEGRVVQDADRLDAIGAIGIARAFAFGGSRGRAMYDPEQAPSTYTSKEAYRDSKSSTHQPLLREAAPAQGSYAHSFSPAAGTRIATGTWRHFCEEFMEEWQGHR